MTWSTATPACAAWWPPFYELTDELPEAYAIRKLHPHDLSGSRDKHY
jgi:hemoglobin